MKTIFDYTPSESELQQIGFYSFLTFAALNCTEDAMTRELYLSLVPQEKALFDLALLFELRDQDASEFWDQIPELHAEYLRGFDYEAVAS